MKPIKLRSAMHLKSEPDDYHLLRENGQNAFNFVHFLGPVEIVLEGQRIITEKNACIIYAPYARQEYSAIPGGFINNFVTFFSDDPLIITRFGLPQNKVFYVEDGRFITEAVEYISWAFVDIQEDHSQDLLERLYQLLRELSERQVVDNPRNQRLFQTRRRFINLREEVSRSPKEWTVERMAKSVYLTRSRFYVVYRSMFGTSPSSDLINMTMDFARNRLLMTDEPISQVAQVSGYDSVEHFIRLFHSREGMTPGQYRKKHKH